MRIDGVREADDRETRAFPLQITRRKDECIQGMAEKPSSHPHSFRASAISPTAPSALVEHTLRQGFVRPLTAAVCAR